MDRRGFLVGAAALSGVLAGCTSSSETTGPGENASDGGEGVPPDISFEVAALREDKTLPARHTCDGTDISPELIMTSIAPAVDSLAVVFLDTSVRPEPFVHWTLWDLPATISTIPAGVATRERVEFETDAGGVEETVTVSQGVNSSGSVGYVGPCPPEGDGRHVYGMRLYGLPEAPDVDPGAEWSALEPALEESSLGRTVVTVWKENEGPST
ncbi:YbhB/YbcL family Raf kinase inhibitor-like protein [Halomarina ordinaria]|uniref:YbhB/YbcL family Raf kinase inhibitor-like protein n=1 Tax=Halomarina ordinaria TaxID=3033939 RepID=A0ABD5UCM8_9EURY|nr:YbhB/YbcL family Raf kinase inhibitor-like protein [Halomarina sp. PSRA2]